MVFVHSNRSGWRMIDARVRHGWNSQARPGYRREMVRSTNQMTNRRCTSGSPLWISAFQNFSFQHFPRGFTEPTLVLVPRTKYRHGSARA
jgi:hypothetical protein